MSTGSPDRTVTAFPKFELDEQLCVSKPSESAGNSSIDINELRALRFRVRHLEAQTSALKTQIKKLTASLAETLLRNIASTRCR